MRGRGRLIAMLALLLALSGCRPLVTDGEKDISIYATTYPIYALADALMEGVPNARLHCLIQPQDGCMRSYQLSDWDIYLLANSADAVIAGGRGLESFESTLFSWGDKGPAVSAVLYNLELYEGQSAGETTSEDASHLEGPNPHLYMSVDGVETMLEAVSGTLMALDPRYGELYADNEVRAEAALEGLRARMEGVKATCGGSRVILMNEALIYLALDCGLEVADWVDRESGVALYGSDLEDMLARLGKSNAKVVLIERQAPASLVEALRENGYSVALIDILSTHREGEGFDTYIRAQEDNADAVLRAFEEVAH